MVKVNHTKGTYEVHPEDEAGGAKLLHAREEERSQQRLSCDLDIQSHIGQNCTSPDLEQDHSVPGGRGLQVGAPGGSFYLNLPLKSCLNRRKQRANL